MARQARVVIPGLPHHITQRGNNREGVFFVDGDRVAYLGLLRGRSRHNVIDLRHVVSGDRLENRVLPGTGYRRQERDTYDDEGIDASCSYDVSLPLGNSEFRTSGGSIPNVATHAVGTL